MDERKFSSMSVFPAIIHRLPGKSYIVSLNEEQ